MGAPGGGRAANACSGLQGSAATSARQRAQHLHTPRLNAGTLRMRSQTLSLRPQKARTRLRQRHELRVPGMLGLELIHPLAAQQREVLLGGLPSIGRWPSRAGGLYQVAFK